MLLLTSTLLLAQGIDGTLRGEVKDPRGGLVLGAKVTITHEQTGLQRSQESTSAGFNFPSLLVGTYTVTVEYQGFKKYVHKGIEVKANQVSEVSAALELGVVTQTVEVTAGAELVQTTTSQLGTTWNSRQLSDIPLPVLSGDPQNLAILQTGTTTQSGGVVGVGGAIGGNRPRNNNFTLDGVDNNDVTVTGPVQPVIPDAVAEFTLITNQFSAEYGHSTAGQFILTTKSGTNSLHGNAFWFVNNRNFNALDNLDKAGILRGDIPEKPRFDRNRLGGTVGGPIFKDRLFFFGAYQFTNVGQAATPGSQALVPTAAGFTSLNSLASTSGSGVSSTMVGVLTSILPPAPTASQNVPVINQATGAPVLIPVGPVTPSAPNFLNQHDFNVNIDYNTAKHRLSGRYSYDRQRNPDVAAFPVPTLTGGIEFDVRSAILSHAFTINPRVVNEFRVGYRRSVFAVTVPSLKPPGGLDAFPNFIIEELQGLEIGPDGNAPQSGVINAYQAVNTLSVATGRHNLKFGVDTRLWIAPSFFLPRARAEYRYSDLNTFVKDLVPDNLALRGVGDGSFAGNQKAVYWFVHDDWKIHPRLTLNLGLRYEFVTNPRDSAKQGINATADLAQPTNRNLPPLLFRVPKQDINNFAPKFGFAYDVFGDHRTSVRGGFGIAYDFIFQNLPLLQLPPQLQQELGTDAACLLTPRPAWCASGTAFVAGGGLPGTFVPQTLTPAEARAGTQGLIVDTVMPVTYTWSLGVQREMWRNWAVDVRYVGTRGLRLPVQVRRNARLVPPDNLFLPVFFKTSDVPASLPVTAPKVAAFLAAAVRPYAVDGFSSNITAFDPVGKSIYHGGSVEVTRGFSGLGRWANGLFLRSGYTWSKTIDDSTNELFTSQVNPRRPENTLNLRNERGLSVLHHAHKFTLAAIWELPKYGGSNGFLKGLLNLWQVSTSYIAETGQPVTALSFIDANGNGDAAGDRAILNPNGSGLTATDVRFVCRNPTTGATLIASSGTACRSAFGLPPTVNPNTLIFGYVAQDPTAQYVRARPGSKTNVGRNTLSSAGINNWNFSFIKKTNITEKKYVEFRTDMLNALNHPQPILGSGNINVFTGNAINGTGLAFVGNNPDFQNPQNLFTTGRRLIQFVLKVVF